MLAHLDGGARAYGVNTGLGYLAATRIEPDEQHAFQRAILRRGAGLGPPFPAAVVRGAMLLRLAGFLHGAAGVSARALPLPRRPAERRLGAVGAARGIAAAGEVIALEHLFQTLIGEGFVHEGGERVPARRCARPPRRRAVRAGRQGGHRAGQRRAARARARRMAGRRGRALVEHATLAGALTAALAGASLRPYARRIGAPQGRPGAAAGARAARRAATGGADWADRPQGPVSFRVLPRCTAPCSTCSAHLDAQVARELARGHRQPAVPRRRRATSPRASTRAATSTPQALALRSTRSPIGVAQVGNLSEKRLHRLLDRRFSGLPDQLAAEPGRQTRAGPPAQGGGRLRGREPPARRARRRPRGRHARRARRTSRRIAFLAAEKLGRILDNARADAGRRARRGAPGAPPARRAARRPRWTPRPPRLAAASEPVGEDRDLSGDLERMRALIRSGGLSA